MEFDTQVRLAIYGHIVETGECPSSGVVADRIESTIDAVLASYSRLSDQRLLVLEPSGATIRMANPFSGVPTPHVVEVEGIHFYANCAWDALGVGAALQKPAIVHSRCVQSGETLRLPIGLDGPEPSDWLFHCNVPTAHWWDNIVFT